jgi:hypothetical protein
MLEPHRRKSHNHNPNPINLARVVSALRRKEESKPHQPVTHNAPSDIIPPVNVDSALSLGDSVRSLRVRAQSISPPAEDSSVEKTAGRVENIAHNPVPCKIIERRAPAQRRVSHREKITRAQLHVREHDDHEPYGENESADESCQGGIAGSQAGGAAYEEEVEGATERDGDAAYEGFEGEVEPGEMCFGDADLLGELEDFLRRVGVDGRGQGCRKRWMGLAVVCHDVCDESVIVVNRGRRSVTINRGNTVEEDNVGLERNYASIWDITITSPLLEATMTCLACLPIRFRRFNVRR